MNKLPPAEIIVIGGGAIGCGVAYALAKAGHSDILLIEREVDVGAVTTSQGAGLCGQLRDTRERVELAMHSVSTFRELQKTEQKPDWHEVGSIRVALSERRAGEFKRLKTAADGAGLVSEWVDRSAAAKRWPEFNFSRVTAVLWCPSDGWMTPRMVAKSYEHACRKMGVHVATSTRVEEIVVSNGQVTGVKTNQGLAECRYVINAAGAHAYHVAKLAGLELPIVPVRHEYYITVPMAGLPPDLPCFRIPELTLYGRVRDGGLLLGGWEPRSMHLDPRSYSLADFPPAVQPDWEVLKSFETSFGKLFPTASGLEKGFVGKGWPTFTPDGRFIIGESCRVKGLVMAGGCNAHGISGSGGIGKLLVQSLFDRHPSPYVKSLSPDRFTESAWTWDDARKQAARVYETYYGV